MQRHMYVWFLRHMYQYNCIMYMYVKTGIYPAEIQVRRFLIRNTFRKWNLLWILVSQGRNLYIVVTKSSKYFWGKNPRDLLLHSISVSGWERSLEIYSSPPTHTNLDEGRGEICALKLLLFLIHVNKVSVPIWGPISPLHSLKKQT